MKRPGEGTGMKGDMIDIFATLIFIGGVIATVIFIRAYFISYTGGVQTPMENMEALQAAYAVESCFVLKSGGEYISADFLDQQKDRFVGESNFCNIQYPPINARVKDMETGKEWGFTRPQTIAALKAVLVNAPSWVWDKIETIWSKQRERSQPKHTIFVPITYPKVTGFGASDVLLGNGKKYVIAYSQINEPIAGDDLKLDVYPIDRYDKSLSWVTAENTVKIASGTDLDKLKKEMKEMPAGTVRTKVVENYYKDITAGDITPSGFGLTADIGECGHSAWSKMCITSWSREIHGGMLYVEI